MPIRIPIISDFDERGVKKAVSQFKRLETTGEKAGFALRQAGKLAAAGIASAAVGLAGAATAAWSFAKAAMADQVSQLQLSRALKASAKATDAQVKSTEKWITKTQMALGIADDQLRPALARLVRSTKDVGQAQRILSAALDVSAQTGRPLEQVVQALGRAYDGNKTALGRLGLGFDKAQLKAMSFNDILGQLEKKTGGSAAAKANTFAGKMDRLKQAFNEMKESLGVVVLEYLQKFVDFGSRIGDAYGEGGAGGALSYFFEQLKKMVLYDENGQLNKFGKSLNFIANVYRGMTRVGSLAYATGYTAGAALATPLTGSEGYNRYQLGLDKFGRALTGKGYKFPLGNFGATYQAPAGPTEMRAGRSVPKGFMGPVAPTATNIYVTNNFSGLLTDEMAVAKKIRTTLAAYDRRMGLVK